MLLARLAIPILQGPMLGASTQEMSIAVSNAGGMGCLACAASPPSKIAEITKQMYSKTKNPFCINLFMLNDVHPNENDKKQINATKKLLQPLRDELGLGPFPSFSDDFVWHPNVEKQVEAVCQAKPPCVSFTFGCPDSNIVRELKASGIFILVSATSTEECSYAAEVGVDGVILQSHEAGGHRGSFLPILHAKHGFGRYGSNDGRDSASMGSSSLIRNARKALGDEFPLIAAGGISDGNQVAAALLLGANAVSVGSAFLLSNESSASSAWKSALKNMRADSTRISHYITGRDARGIDNRLMKYLSDHEKSIPRYPFLNVLTKEIRESAAKKQDSELLNLWAGQSARLIKEGSAAEITHSLWDSARSAFRGKSHIFQ